MDFAARVRVIKEKQTLKGKTVLVTGSTRGIGLDVAKGMLARGANVMFHGTTKIGVEPMTEEEKAKFADFREELEKLQKKYPTQKLAYYGCDISKGAQVQALIEETAKFGGGKIDVLVNNAGIQIPKSIETISHEEFDRLIKIHLNGAFYATQAALPYMKRSGDKDFSQIINMSSVHGIVPSPERSPYCSAKFALQGFTGVTANEHAKDNIRVNTINPAFVDTDLAMEFVDARAKKNVENGMTEDDAKQEAKTWRLQLQGGEWVSMPELVKATVDLADFTDPRATGEAVVLDNDLYVKTAKAAPGGAAHFKPEVADAVSQLDGRIEKYSEKIASLTSGRGSP